MGEGKRLYKYCNFKLSGQINDLTFDLNPTTWNTFVTLPNTELYSVYWDSMIVANRTSLECLFKTHLLCRQPLRGLWTFHEISTFPCSLLVNFLNQLTWRLYMADSFMNVNDQMIISLEVNATSFCSAWSEIQHVSVESDDFCQCDITLNWLMLDITCELLC